MSDKEEEKGAEAREDEAGPSTETRITAEAIQQLASHPATLEALTKKIASYMNAQQPPEQVLSRPVKRRVRALKSLQYEFTKLETEFYREVQQLEAKYSAKYQPLFDKRREVVTGSHEPNDEECHWSGDEGQEEEEEEEEEEEKQGEEGEKKADKETEGATPDAKKEEKGIPDFWFTALKNTDLFTEMIKEHDEPVLEHLTDIKVVFLDGTGTDFRLDFCFSDNEWFTNKVLGKTYYVSCDLNKDAPWEYEGATITSCKGCKIDWKKGKNLTVKTVKKKQKHKGRGQSRTVTKTVPNESFFNFYSPPDPEKDVEDEDGEAQELLAGDYLRAEFLRDRLVPKAVLFFTGEALEDDGDEFEEGEDEEDEDEEDEEYDARQDLDNAKPDCKQQ